MATHTFQFCAQMPAFSFNGKFDCEPCPDTLFALYADRTAMGFDDGLHNRKPKAKRTLPKFAGARTGFIGPEKTLEYLREIFTRDTNASIRESKAYSIACARKKN